MICVLVIVSSGCSYHRAYVSYEEGDGTLPIRRDGWQGERLGTVSAKEGGAIWKNCTRVAEGSVWVLMEETRKLGGNAIGEIRWFPERRATTDPVCRQGWGWVLIWPVLATPAFQSARAVAVAYRVDESVPMESGMFLIPESVEERRELAARIAADTREAMPAKAGD
jgi:hypothetical protein